MRGNMFLVWDVTPFLIEELDRLQEEDMREKGAKKKFKVENYQVIAQCWMARNSANLGEMTEKD